MDEALKRIAAEIVPQLTDALDELMKPDAREPQPSETVRDILWDNKVGILRVLQAAANS